jgi:BolA protein
MTYSERIIGKIQAAFTPAAVRLEDESAQHKGHAGAHPSGETHFKLYMVAAAFNGKSRLERQRMVYAALKDEMAERVHALSMVLHSTEETT